MKVFPILLSVIICSCFTACVSHRDLVNFNEGDPFPTAPINIPSPPPLLIQPDDLLAISVHATESDLVAPFNLYGNRQNNASYGAEYLVDSKGFIQYPGLGDIPVAGLNLEEIRAKITGLLTPFLKEPIVLVRYLNFKFTVMGEVRSPGNFTASEEKLTLLEALGKAGDLTNYGNRRNILLMREQNGQRSYNYLNIQDRRFFDSPFFYLQQNDYIYVEPIKAKIGTVSDQLNKALPWISVGSVVLNLVFILTRR